MSNRALCIGINDYPGTKNDLSGCVNDAHDWAQELEARGFHVATLLDRAATKAAMVAALAKLIGNAAAGDMVTITYSGHGTYQPDNDGDEADGLDEGLCPHDIKTAGALVDDEIRALFAARAPGVRLLLISDSCHSGTVTRSAPAAQAPNGTRPRFMPMGDWLDAERLPRSRNGQPAARLTIAPHLVSPLAGGLIKQFGDLLLAGCQEGPNNYSYDAQIDGRANGAFTHYALKALHQLPPTASYAEWHKAIRNYLPAAPYPQTPQLVGNAAARKRQALA